MAGVSVVFVRGGLVVFVGVVAGGWAAATAVAGSVSESSSLETIIGYSSGRLFSKRFLRVAYLRS